MLLRRINERCCSAGRAAGAFEIQISKRKSAKGKDRLSITWRRRQSLNEWIPFSEGCFLLQTNLSESDPATLWKQYNQLTEAEQTFRIEKDEMNIQ